MSDRIQRRIEQLLDEVDEAMAQTRWDVGRAQHKRLLGALGENEGEETKGWYTADRYLDSKFDPPTEEQAREALAAAQPLIDRLRAGLMNKQHEV